MNFFWPRHTHTNELRKLLNHHGLIYNWLFLCVFVGQALTDNLMHWNIGQKGTEINLHGCYIFLSLSPLRRPYNTRQSVYDIYMGRPGGSYCAINCKWNFATRKCLGSISEKVKTPCHLLYVLGMKMNGVKPQFKNCTQSYHWRVIKLWNPSHSIHNSIVIICCRPSHEHSQFLNEIMMGDIMIHSVIPIIWKCHDELRLVITLT